MTVPGIVASRATADGIPSPGPTGYDAAVAGVTSAGLVARWRLGADAMDAVGGLNGAVSGGVTFGQTALPAGGTDGAALFDGTTGYIEVADDPALRLAAATLVAWIKPASLHNGVVFAKEASGGNEQDLTLRLVSDGSITAFGTFNGLTANATTDPGFYGVGEELCVALRIGANGLEILVNGVAAASDLQNAAGLEVNSRALTIGAARYGTGSSPAHFFDGVIDEAMVFDGVLSDADLRRLALIPPVAQDIDTDTVQPTAGPFDIDFSAHVLALPDATFAVSGLDALLYGTATFDGAHTVTYNPANTGEGDDTFTYTVADTGGSDQATVTITVSSAADAYETAIQGVPGLVAHWRLGDLSDEASSPAALTDPSGAVSFDGISNLAGGSTGGAAVFDGATAHLSGGDPAKLRLAAGTIIAWARPDAVHDGAIISKDVPGAAAGEFTLRLASDGTILAFFGDGTTNHTAQSPTAVYAAGQTLCVALGFGGSAGIEMFVDGSRVAQQTGYTGGIDANPNALTIGAALYGTGSSPAHLFDGVIDEVAVYDRRLSADEIRRLAQAAPVADDFSAGQVETGGAPVAIDLRAHARALSTATFSVSGLADLAFGTATFDGAHTVTYTPGADQGADSFGYTVTDALGSDSGSVSITVGAVAGDYGGLVTDGVVAHLRLGTALDSQGTLAAGTASNVTFASPSLHPASGDGRAEFNGSTSQIDFAHVPALALANATVTLLFRADRLHDGHLVSKAAASAPSGSATHFWTRLHADGSVSASIRTNSATTTARSRANTYEAGATHQIAVMVGGGWWLSVYLDGLLVAQEPIELGLDGNTQPLRLGRDPSGGTAFDGAMDELRIYDRRLDLDVTELYTLGRPFIGLPIPPLSAALRVVNVSNASALGSALSGAQPGDHILIAPGSYGGTFTLNADGTRAHPIVVRARDKPVNGVPTVTFTNGSRMVLNGDHARLVYCEFDGATGGNTQGNVHVTGRWCRVSRCRGRSLGYRWMICNGVNGRADHCDLASPSVAGWGMALYIDTSLSSGPCNWLWDGHYFHDNPGAARGTEVIGFGSHWTDWPFRAFVTLERTLIRNWDGLDEITSTKTNDCTYRDVTCEDSTARFGSRNGFRTAAFSCWFEGVETQGWRQLGDRGRLIGCRFTGGTDCAIHGGSATCAEFESVIAAGNWDHPENSYPRSENTLIVGCRMDSPGVFRIGVLLSIYDERALNTRLEANTGTVNFEQHTGTTTSSTTTRAYRAARKLTPADVGLGAYDPLCDDFGPD